VNVQPFLIGDGWIEVRDGDPTGRDIFSRHYTFRRRPPGEQPLIYVGPGFKLVLLSADGDALCAWRKADIRQDGQTGIECCIFRREGDDLASSQLRAAMHAALHRWPGERMFTFVDPRAVAPTWRAGRPTWGHCFYQAGWKFVGLTKKGLHILAYEPEVA
jgi:hypothetical protein